MKADAGITLRAPGKVNLGLDVLGKRSDGFHEIRSVLAMIDVYDDVTVRRAHGPGTPVDPTGFDERNLVQRALDAYGTAVPESAGLSWRLEKRIPIAAGLGGASSDAATALMAANTLSAGPLAHPELASLAATIGSDVPFFLGGPSALVSGRGTDLVPVPAASLELLLLIPREAIRDKTRMLYGMLEPGDFTSGETADRVVEALRLGRPFHSDLLRNAFSRALCTLLPRVAALQERLKSEPDLTWGLSGAGPAHYVVAPLAQQSAVVSWLRAEFGDWLDMLPARTISESPAQALKAAERPW